MSRPRGDIISVYTIFSWPALCAEIAKLKIELPSASSLDGGGKGACYRFCCRPSKGRNR
jgi:hypothetical protein